MHATIRSTVVVMEATAEVPPRRAVRIVSWLSLNPEQLAKLDIVEKRTFAIKLISREAINL